MIIREAGPDDAAALAALYHELTGNPRIEVWPERLAQIQADPNNFLLVAEVDGAVVGTVLLTFCLEATFGNRPYAVVENIVVTERARGGGIGARLLTAVEERARAASCSKIAILSAAQRTRAHAFFMRAGYDGERKRGFVKYLPRAQR